MAERLDLDELRAEYRVPEARAFLLAHLALESERVRRVAAYRRRGAAGMSLLDLAVNLHVLALGIAGGGTQTSAIADNLEAPRQTVRDGLTRLEKGGLVVRDAAGLYHPSEVTGAMLNDILETDFRLIGRACDAFAAWRAAVGR